MALMPTSLPTMRMVAGHISLSTVFDFAARNNLPGQKSKSVQSEYSKLLKLAVAHVPELSGLYLWGYFDDTASWKTIYVGKTEKKITSSLRTRMYDELRETFCPPVWAELHGSETVLRQTHYHYPHGKYDAGTRIKVSMVGVRYVIWVGFMDGISGDDIQRQEVALMKVWESTHNINRKWKGDNSPDDHTAEISSIIKDELSKVTHYELPMAYKLPEF